MDPLDFIKTANSLESSNEEADRRSAVSRAYYAVFNHIKRYLKDCGIYIPENHTAHIKIARYLRYSGLSNAKEMGDAVENLRDERWDADYELGLNGPSKNDCKLIVLKAQQTIQSFDSCKRSELINGIRQYQKIERGDLPS